MNFRPALASLIAGCALAASGLSHAASITLSSDQVVDPDLGISGSFEHRFELDPLATPIELGFSLRVLTEGSAATDLTISRVVFVRDGSSVEFDAAADGSQLRRLGGGQMAFGASTDAYADYALDPLLLTAGFWSVLVYGQDSDNKLWSSYELRGSAAPGRVPEPAALALVLVAGLAAAGGATRRKG
jgi:hypothetical protein